MPFNAISEQGQDQRNSQRFLLRLHKLQLQRMTNTAGSMDWHDIGHFAGVRWLVAVNPVPSSALLLVVMGSGATTAGRYDVYLNRQRGVNFQNENREIEFVISLAS